MLREKRKERGLTLDALAEAAGLSRRTLQYWERRGLDEAKVGNVAKVAAVLECTVDELLGDLKKEDDRWKN